MATLKEVAAASGVHPAAVSCIVNGSKGNSRFSEATRVRVLRAAEKLGYKPNQLARQLKWRRTRTIGFIGGNIRNPFFALLTTCLERQLQAHGYDLLLRCCGSDTPAWRSRTRRASPPRGRASRSACARVSCPFSSPGWKRC